MSLVGAADDTAGQEVRSALHMWRLWTFMSWQDIRNRYRGSVLGPFWVAGGIAAASLGAGVLYSRILKVNTEHLVAFISVGVSLWTLITLTLTEACHAFVGVAGLIRNAALPRPVHILRVISRNLIVFAHGLVVVAAVFAITRTPLTPGSVLAVPGLLLVVVNLVWMSWLLAAASARFRDVIQIAVYALQFAIFVTPIFWYPNLAGRNFPLLALNPLYHLIEVVRGPLLGYGASPQDWTWVIGMAVVGLLVAGVSFRRLRHDVAFWV